MISFYPVPVLEISLPAKYVGRRLSGQYPEQSKKNYELLCAAIAYHLFPKNQIHREVNFAFYLNNVFNKKYESTGYTYGYYSGGALVNENFSFPSGRNKFYFFNVIVIIS